LETKAHTNLIHCPVCVSSDVTLDTTQSSAYYIDKYKHVLNIDVSNYFTGIEQVEILDCKTCSYRFYHPFSLQAQPEFYENLSHNDTYYLEEKWEFEIALSKLKKGMKVLEIGCGEGNFLEMAYNHGIFIEGLDTGKNLLTESKSGIPIHKQVIETFAQDHANEFDAIVSLQVLEHLTEIQNFINASLYCLKPTGKLILAVPNIEAKILRYDENNCLNMPPHHMGLFSPKAFGNLSKHYPMRLLSLKKEPLSIDHSKRYYRIYITHIRKKLGIFGMALDKILYPISETMIHALRTQLNGQSMLAEFRKNNRS